MFMIRPAIIPCFLLPAMNGIDFYAPAGDPYAGPYPPPRRPAPIAIGHFTDLI